MFRTFVIAVTLFFCGFIARAETITVSAAISLKESLLAIAEDYQATTGEKVEFNFGASGQLMLQIQQGAPVDAFVSAAQKQVTQLRTDGLLTDAPDRIVVRNRLVLIVPPGRQAADSFRALASPATQRIAVGQPKTVPAGDYASQVFQKLQLTDAIKDRLIYGANVRQVLDYVIRGEVDTGVVYASDALEAGDKVKVVATAEEGWHQPIVYPAAILKASTKQAAARRFLDYLLSERAKAAFVQRGFVPADATSKDASVAAEATTTNGGSMR